MLDPRKVPGIVYLMPCGKSPHGVDVSPDGKYIIGSGKLQGVTTAFDFEKVRAAIQNKDFTGDEDGIPVLRYESIKEAEVPVGLGPLHTQFGPNGMAYTSLFVDSAIASWKTGRMEGHRQDARFRLPSAIWRQSRGTPSIRTAFSSSRSTSCRTAGT